MKKILKQIVGIDVAQNELVVCAGRLYDDLSCELYGHKTFTNTPKVFVSLIEWVTKKEKEVADRFVMEAYRAKTANWQTTIATLNANEKKLTNLHALSLTS